jgi:hypothetical protein
MYVCLCDVNLVFSLEEVEARGIECVRCCRVVLVVTHELPIIHSSRNTNDALNYA